MEIFMEFKDNLQKLGLNLNFLWLRLGKVLLTLKKVLEVIFGIFAIVFLIFLALILLFYKILGDTEWAVASAALLILIPIVILLVAFINIIVAGFAPKKSRKPLSKASILTILFMMGD